MTVAFTATPSGSVGAVTNVQILACVSVAGRIAFAGVKLAAFQ